MSSFVSSLTGWRRHLGRLLAAAVAVLCGCVVLQAVAGDASAACAAGLAGGAALLAGYRIAAADTKVLLAAAYTDPLTGLPTRAVAEHLLRRAADAAGSVTVALADVDNLNEVNVRGHAVGDAYLAAAARRLADAVAGRGTVARLGGDEFVIVTAELSAVQLRLVLEAAAAGGVDVPVRPRVSVGVAEARGAQAAYALACADAALHTVKAAGGDRVAVYDAVRDGIPQREGVRPRLRRRDGPPISQAVPGGPQRLLRLYLSAAEAYGVLHALQALHQRWARAARVLDVAAGADGAAGRLAEVAASPAWQANVGRISRAQADRYGALADRVRQVIDRADALA